MIRVLSKQMAWHHVLAPLCAAAFSFAIITTIEYDRRDPLIFERGEILPPSPAPGSMVRVRWTTVWARACEGEVSREVVGSDLVVRPYLKYELRVPVELGRQTSDSTFTLTESLPPGLTRYQATIRFDDCGITSRIWPLTVETDRLYFEVR